MQFHGGRVHLFALHGIAFAAAKGRLAHECMEIPCTRRCEANRNRKQGPQEIFFKREGCRLACWPLGGCGQYYRCRGMRRFFPFLDSLRASERIDRSTGANRRICERAVFRSGLSAGSEGERNRPEENGFLV